MSAIVFPADLKPTFSGHETFPLRQLWLRKAYVEIARHGDVASKGVFSDDDAIERFGVGKNMVASIKHWALACDVIRQRDSGDGYFIGEVGQTLFGSNGCDQFLEHDATLWLVHWLLAGRATRSTTWYVLFNFIQSQTFTQKQVVDLLLEHTAQSKSTRSDKTLTNDVAVCLRCYTAVSTRSATEDLAEPLLTDLGLVVPSGEGFQFHRGPQYSLPDGVFAYAVLDYWRRWERNVGASQATLSFNAIAHDYGSPGRVFKLDEDSVGERLSKISDTTKDYLQWTDTAGIRQVSRTGKGSMDECMVRSLRGSYAK